MTFGSINRSEIEIKPSVQGNFIEIYQSKENEKQAAFLKILQPKAIS